MFLSRDTTILGKIDTNLVLKIKQTKNNKGVMFLYSQSKQGAHFIQQQTIFYELQNYHQINTRGSKKE